MTLHAPQLQQGPQELHQVMLLRQWLWLGPGLSLAMCLLGGVMLILPVDQWLGVPWMIQEHVPQKARGLNAFLLVFGAVTGTGVNLSDLHPAYHFTFAGQALISVLMSLGLIHRLVFGLMLSLLMLGKLAEKLSPHLLRKLSYESKLWKQQWMRVFIVVTVMVIILQVLGCKWLLILSHSSHDLPMTVWQAWFDAGSALSDNGLSLRDSIANPQDRAFAWLGFFPLLLIGGLGVPLCWELSSRAWKWIASFLPGQQTQELTHPLSLHAQMTLIAGSMVVIIATLALCIFMGLDALINEETGNNLPDQLKQVFLDSAYLVSTRSSAFADAEMQRGHPIALFLIIPLLMIGGGAGSAMGGLSLTVIAIPLLSFWSFLKGRDEIEAHQRIVPGRLLRHAITLILVMIGLACLGIYLMGMVEPYPLDQLTLRVFSAVSNSGLGMLSGAALTGFSKTVLMHLMWLGLWTGPTLIAAANLREVRQPAYQYPREDLTLG